MSKKSTVERLKTVRSHSDEYRRVYCASSSTCSVAEAACASLIPLDQVFSRTAQGRSMARPRKVFMQPVKSPKGSVSRTVWWP